MDERFQVYYNMTRNSISLYCVMITITAMSLALKRMTQSTASGGWEKRCVTIKHTHIKTLFLKQLYKNGEFLAVCRRISDSR